MKRASNDLPETILNALSRGGWKPGDRLPDTATLARLLGLRHREVQRGLAALAARGILERKPGVGTVLLKKRRIPQAVMLVRNNLHREIAHSNRMRVEATREKLLERGYGLVVLDDFASIHREADAAYPARMERLKEQLRRADPVGFLEINCSLNRYPPLYEVFRRPAVRYAPPGVGGDVYHDRRHLLRSTLEFLAKRGRRKVAVLRAVNDRPLFAQDDELWELVREFGFLRCQIREVFSEGGVDLERRGWELGTTLVAEWKALRKNYVPDCLLVIDDILMLGVAAALRQSPFDIPGEMELVAVTTEGVPIHYGLPVHRYEISRRKEAQALVECFEARLSRSSRIPGPVVVPGRLQPFDATSP